MKIFLYFIENNLLIISNINKEKARNPGIEVGE